MTTTQTETRRYKMLEEYQRATKQDVHSLLVDYDIFMNVPRLDGRDVKTVQKPYDTSPMVPLVRSRIGRD